MKPQRRQQRPLTKSRPHRTDPLPRSRANLLYGALALLTAGVVVVAFWWVRLPSSSSTAQQQAGARQGPVAQTSRLPLRIVCPFDGSVFPPDMAPAQFQWEDETELVDHWRIRIEFADGQSPLEVSSSAHEWTPEDDQWQLIKEHTVAASATVTICGASRQRADQVLSRDTVSISTSRDPVEAPIFYREVNLPFIEAVKDPARHIRWRFGSIASPQQPPVVLKKPFPPTGA